MSFFKSIESAPADPILGLAQLFNDDKRKEKINLGIGSYKDSNGRSFVLNCVRKAESIIHEQHLNKDYLPITGNPQYVQATLKLIFGDTAKPVAEGTILGAQTIGGTGALRMGGEFLIRNEISNRIYLSDPTWPNHNKIFNKAGLIIDVYPYYNYQTNTLNYEAMCQAIQKMPKGSTILLQPCCHNPTGLTPSFDEWKVLSELIKKQEIIPFFDIAYQGFERSVDEDAEIIRYFMNEGHEMLVASSYSKNFGLYGERMGHLAIVCHNSQDAERAGSQLKQIIRANYSTPTLHGARIVTTILESEELKNEWIIELNNMKMRIQEMRSALASELVAKVGDDRFDFLHKQSGMFSLSGLDPESVHLLRTNYGIYMPSNGRINLAGLNIETIEYFVKALVRLMGRGEF